MNSKFLNLNLNDFTKGLIVVVLTAIVVGLEQILQTGNLPTVIQLKVIGLATLSAGIAYLVKNFLSNSEGKFLGKEVPTDPAGK